MLKRLSSVKGYCHSDPAVAGEESLINFFRQAVGPQSEIFRFAQHDMTTLSASTQ